MSELFTPEFIERQREIIKAATDGKWLVGRTPEVDAEQDYAGHYVGGFTGADVYDRDMGVYAMFFCDRDDETQIDPETICAPWSEADAEHIAEAHNHYPAALDEIERLRAELNTARNELENACALVAKMHEAAVGEVRGPIDGVVEDVKNLRAQLDEARAEIAALK